MAKKYHKLGSMIEKREKGTEKPILDKDEKKTYYFKVDKDVKITVNGKEVPAGAFLNVKRPYDYDYRQHYVAGKISEEEYLAKKEKYEKGGTHSYIQFELEFVSEE